MTQFTAVWCGPCRFIAPAVEKLAAEHSGRVSFLKVDIDAEALQGTVNASGVAAVVRTTPRPAPPPGLVLRSGGCAEASYPNARPRTADVRVSRGGEGG